MTLSIAPFDAAGRKRIAQLISKSNQYNVTTRRYSEAEVAALQSNPDAVTLQARLEDIFGDNGMISAVICLRQDRRGNRYLDHVLPGAWPAGRGSDPAASRAAGPRSWHHRADRPLPTDRQNGLVRDHFSKLGFAGIDALPGGETTWRLVVGNYDDKDLPMRVDALPSPGSASAA
jgi:hypothetical protein